jgi:nicotinamidase-related amidase
VDSLLFAGVNADQCVLHTLADANALGYDTILLADATGTTSPAFCMEATLYNVRQVFGFTTTTAAIMRAIAEG